VAEVNAASEDTVTLLLFPDPPQTPPEHETNEVKTWKFLSTSGVSVTVTPKAASGPLLVIMIV
jgi:hypothetical protein